MQTYIKKLNFVLSALFETSSPSFLALRCCPLLPPPHLSSQFCFPACCHRPTFWTHNSTRGRVSTLSGKICSLPRWPSKWRRIEICRQRGKASEEGYPPAPKSSLKKTGPREAGSCGQICRVDRKMASCAFCVSTRQAFGQKLPISLLRRRIIGLLLYSGCQCGKSDRKIWEGVSLPQAPLRRAKTY